MDNSHAAQLARLAALEGVPQSTNGTYEIEIHYIFNSSLSNTISLGSHIYEKYRATHSQFSNALPLLNIIKTNHSTLFRFIDPDCYGQFASANKMTQSEAINLVAAFVEALILYGTKHLSKFESDSYRITIYSKEDIVTNSHKLVKNIVIFATVDWDTLRSEYCTPEAKTKIKELMCSPSTYASPFRSNGKR